MSTLKHPPLQMVPAKIDLGNVVEGANISSVLRLSNLSNKIIFIESATTSCGCTTADVPHKILPNSQENIQIQFHSQDRAGKINQVVHIKAKGFSEPIDIPVMGECSKEISLSSRIVTLDKEQKGTLIVENIDNKPLVISSIETSKPIVAEVASLSPMRSQISFSLQGISLAGSHEGFATIHTNCSGLPFVKIPISWRTEGVYHISPPTANFGLVVPNSLQKATIEITGGNVDKLKISTTKNAKVDDSTLETALVRQSSQNALLTVAWKASNQGASFLQGTVELSTGNPAEPLISIPVYAAIGSSPDECNTDRPCSSKSEGR
jgi:hypothetical protein